MDLITTAIIAALAKLSEPVIKDAYEGLKALISRKFGDNSHIAEAVDQLEKDPGSAGRKEVLKEKIATVGAAQDLEVVGAAQALLERLQAQPGGQQLIHQVVTGNENVFSGSGNVTVNATKK